MAKDFRELVVWEQAMLLAERVYDMTRELPADERFGLTSQMRRAAVSIPSCIAEGNARASIPDYLRFLSIAAGSLAELRTQSMLARRLGYTSEARSHDCDKQLTRVEMLLKRLQRALRLTNRESASSSPSRFPFPVSRR